MQIITRQELEERDGFFEVLASTFRSQIAFMILQPDQESGPYGNEHPDSDQVVYVTKGEGVAIIEGKEHKIGEGDLVLIKARENHQVKGAGGSPMHTLNFYSPPAY